MPKLLMSLAIALSAIMTSPAFAGNEQGTYGEKNIVETATAAGNFTTLLAAAKAAGLVETLQSDGPLTVFAPTDKAFAKLPSGTVETLLKPKNKEKLVSILKYHVVSGEVTAEKVMELEEAETLGGTVTIETKDGVVMVNDAKVVKADIMTKNGVIHVIDKVLLPKE